MSSSSFLQKMRKAQLEELSSDLGLNTEGLKKTQLEVLLDEHLTSHAELASDARVAPFYKRRSSGESPVKKEASTALADTERAVKSVKRRVTKAAEELTRAGDDSDVEPATTRARTALARTPARALALASSVPLPPSPAIVADVIDRRTAVIRHQISSMALNSGVIEAAESTRESLSSVVSVEFLILVFEAFNLRKEILADRYAFTIPALPVLHTSPHPVAVPDLFLLLTASFWQPFVLWIATSLLVPLLFAYFFNLTARPRAGRAHQRFEYAFDPLTFNIVKAVVTYAVYAQDVTFGGLVDLESVARIRAAAAGGWEGVVAGTAVGILVTFYEAIIRK